MPANSFGTRFTFTTFGESHGPAIGVVIDGCPPGIPLTAAEIDEALAKRAPGRSPYTSPRAEPDTVEILSGLFKGETTGTPLTLLIRNRDADSTKYEPIKHLLRPGHATHTYLAKYGRFDYRGGGRASARETACRVAAGAVAKKVLGPIMIKAYLHEIAGIKAEEDSCAPSPAMAAAIEAALADGDSVGGIVEVRADGLPPGLGDPIYDKLEALLAHAMLSIPSARGFEIGNGFEAARLRASEQNDLYLTDGTTATNHAGGVLAGISTGMPLICRVAFKAPSSIRRPQPTIDVDGNEATFALPEGSRHDPCTAIRAVPICEAMCALVLADRFLLYNNPCLRN